MKEKYQEMYKQLGLTIAFYRKKKEWTQDRLAEAVGVDQTHISKIEVASVGISIDMLFAISEALEVPAYKLLHFPD